MLDGFLRKQDLRITKTNKALKNAVVSLLSRYSSGKITVNDICEEAFVSRSTFYMCFEDKYDLLKFCLKELKNELVAGVIGGSEKQVIGR